MKSAPSPSALSPARPPAWRRPGVRWLIALLLCVASELNYLDRQTLSVLAQTIQDDLHLTTIQYAQITSAFLLSYTIMYAVSGVLVDRLGSRKSFGIFVTAWSIATALHAFGRSAIQFATCRFLLGASESANFPAGIKAVSEWFPLRERALAVGIFNAGTAVGAAAAAPVVSWIALTWGWRYSFVAIGVLGFAWVAVWLLVYRSPRQHPWVREDELALIEEGVKQSDAAEPRASWREILRLRVTWGCIFARMLTDPISYFFIFWTPKYLQQERGFNLADVGKYSWIPFVSLAIGNVAGGAIPRWLVARGWTVNRGRKTVMFIASCTMPFACLLITRVQTAGLAVALISTAMFCHAAWANMTLPTEVLPHRMIGTVTGIAGCIGGFAGVLSQEAIGWTVQNVSFGPVFAVCSFLHLTAFGLVCLFIGKIGVTTTSAATARA